MNTIQLSIEATEAQQELLIGLMVDLPTSGFEQQEGVLLAYFPENDFNSYDVNKLLKGYTYTVSTVAPQNWNQLWESNFSPVVVGNFCSIRAHFHQPAGNTAHDIVITPKMSFGTGHHATTFMMVQQMQWLDFSGKTVFDFGTGTGILAILAEKLGAANVIAIDVDDWSIENTTENLAQNGCRKVSVSRSTTIPGEQFHIILANINRNVLLQYMHYLAAALLPGGHILMSGLLLADEQDITAAAQSQQLQLVQKTGKDNWLCLLFTNASASA